MPMDKHRVVAQQRLVDLLRAGLLVLPVRVEVGLRCIREVSKIITETYRKQPSPAAKLSGETVSYEKSENRNLRIINNKQSIINK